MSIRRAFIMFVPVFVVVFGGIGVWRGADSFTGQIYLGRGSELAAQRKYQQAFADYDRAVSLDSDLSEAVALNKAQAYAQQVNYDAALSQVKKALAISPNDGIVYQYRAMVHLSQGQYEAAVSDCNEAIALRPDLPSTYFTRGSAYASLNEPDKAIKDFTSAIVLSASGAKAQAYNARGRLYGTEGKAQQAIADFTSAIKLEPKDALYYYNRGLTYKTIKEDSESLADFKKVISLTSDQQLIEQANQQIAGLNADQP